MALTKWKPFLFTFLAVLGGIWVWSKWQTAKSTGGSLTLGPLTIKPAASPNPTVGGAYYGPDTDPVTGAYLPPGAQPGTVQFSSQNVN